MARKNYRVVYFDFKSSDKFYFDEKDGKKNNTVREIDLEDGRFISLIAYTAIGFNIGEIKIRISPTTEDNPFMKPFVRIIKNISIYKNLMIISWVHKDD